MDRVRLGRHEFCIEGNGSGATTDTGFAVEVEDFAQALTAVEQAGGHIHRPGDLPLAVVTDTEGNRFTVVGPGGCSMRASKFPATAASTTAQA